MLKDYARGLPISDMLREIINRGLRNFDGNKNPLGQVCFVALRFQICACCCIFQLLPYVAFLCHVLCHLTAVAVDTSTVS